MGVTCFDVICRKFGVPIPYTKFQELEWHLHAAIFSLWLGYNYVITRTHASIATTAAPVAHAGLGRAVGCLLFALPYRRPGLLQVGVVADRLRTTSLRLGQRP